MNEAIKSENLMLRRVVAKQTNELAALKRAGTDASEYVAFIPLMLSMMNWDEGSCRYWIDAIDAHPPTLAKRMIEKLNAKRKAARGVKGA